MPPIASFFLRPGYFSRCSTGLHLCLLVLFGVSAQGNTDFVVTGVDRVFNGTFEQNGSAGIALGWTLSGPYLEASNSESAYNAPGRTQRIRLSGGTATLSQSIVLEAGRDYLFSAWVKSGERVVARLGQLSLSYNAQGQWQQLGGLLAGGDSTSLNLTFSMGGLNSAPADIRIESVQLVPVDRPSLLPHPTDHSITPIVSDGQSRVVIVYPTTHPQYQRHAADIQAAISDATGVLVPIASDSEVTATDAPVLLSNYRHRHLILLGRLGINRALWSAYNRFLTAVDGYYPGGDGYVVRTAANVLGNGYNHIIVGGSNETGAAHAVVAFIDALQQAPANGGNLTLPALLDVELGGECLAVFTADDSRWNANPLDPLLPPLEPGYNTVRRWYHNAMAYYWSGWPSYAQRAAVELQQVLADSAYTHHYIAEFMVRTRQMIAHTGLHTPEELAAMDNLILKNFLDFMTPAGDLGWMTTFSPPYNTAITNRHSIAPWMADLKLADYLRENFALQPRLAALVDFRSEEKHRFMQHVLNERWGPSLPGAPYAAAHEEIVLSLFRFALEHDYYAFFTGGNAARALALDRISHRSGRLVDPGGGYDHHLILGMLAHYHADDGYRALMEKLPVSLGSDGPFMGRYVNGVRRYTPGDELAAASLQNIPGTGVRIPLMMPNDRENLHRIERGPYLLPAELDPAATTGIAVIRAGFDMDDDYLALAGISMSRPAGTFHSIVARDMEWIRSGSTDSYFSQNGLLVLRTDAWPETAQSFAAAASLDWSANPGHALGGVSLTLNPFMGTQWQRQVLRIHSGLFIVRDTVTALDAGDFDIAVNWRLTGSPSWDGRQLTLLTNRGRLAVTPLGAGFTTRQDIEDFRDGLIDDYRFYQSANVQMSPGESVTSTTVLQAYRSGQETLLEAQLAGPNQVVLMPVSGGNSPHARVHWNDGLIPGVETDARLLVSTGSKIMVLHATHLSIHQQPVFSSLAPLSLVLDKGSGEISVDPQSADGAFELAVDAAERLLPMDELLATAAGDSDNATLPDSGLLPLQAHDHSQYWQTGWTYKGLHRPVRIPAITALGNDIVDLGEIVELAEIRAATQPSGAWIPLALPTEIHTALPQSGGGPPPPGSPAWQPVNAAAVWNPGVQTGNYGEGVPTAQSFQSVYPGDTLARYVKATGSGSLSYYRADTTRSREPLRLETGPFMASGQAGVFAVSDIPTTWPRNHRLEDASMAMLSAAGEEVFQLDIPGNLQGLQIGMYDGSPEAKIITATWDAQIHVFDLNGEPEYHFDLFAMHQDFQDAEGSPDTRHPAGGFTTPYGIGLWRPDAQGRHKIVVPRYGGVSFLDENGEFEGLLAVGGYASSAILPYGIDFNGNGQEEQLILERFRVVHLDGEAIPYISEPGGSRYFPQVYVGQMISQGDSPASLTGARVLVFEALPWGSGNRYVAVVRETFVGIYDARARNWVFRWHPVAPLRSAAITRAHADRLRIVAATADNLLWELDWRGTLESLHQFKARPLSDSPRRMHANPALTDCVLLPGRHGLYLLAGSSELFKLAAGAFHDSRFIRDGEHEPISIVATTRSGDVLRLDPLPEAPALPAPAKGWEETSFFGFNLILDAGRAIRMDTTNSHREAVRFSAAEAISPDTLRFYLNSVSGNPGLRLSLQGDDGNGNPDGVELFNIAVNAPVAGWNSVFLPYAPQLRKGKVYHLIFYLTNGSADDNIGIRASTTATDISPYLQENSPDPWYIRRHSQDGGQSWVDSGHVAGSVAYIMHDSSAQQSIGQPYVFPQSRTFGGTRWMGQKFVFTGAEPAFVNAVTLRIGRGTENEPADNVRVHLIRADDHALLHTATLLEAAEAGAQTLNRTVRLAWDQRPVLEPGTRYVLAVESTGSANDTYRLAGLNWMYAVGDQRTDFQGEMASAVSGNAASGIPVFSSLNSESVLYDFFFGMETTSVYALPPPHIPVASSRHRAFALQFPSQYGNTYQIQYSPDLYNWLDDSGPITGTNGPAVHATAKRESAFYRLVISGAQIPQSGDTMPPITLSEHATEIRFHSRTGNRYQIQASGDLMRWENLGEQSTGTGGLLRYFTPDSDATYLRVLRSH